MALQPAAQTDMYNRRRQNRATGQPGSTTTAAVRPTEGAIGPGKSYYDFNGNKPGTGYWGNSQPTTQTQPPQQQPPPWTPYSAPGSGEDWWQSHKDQWDKPGAASNYWSGVSGYFTSPTDQEKTIHGYADQLGNTPGSLEKLYDQYYGSGAFTDPGAGERWWSEHGGEYGAPSSGETALGNVVGQYGNSGDMEKWYAQHGGEFNNAGDMERYFGSHIGQLDANNPLARNAGGIASDINSARNTGAFFNATAGDLARPGYAETLADQYNPDQRTYNEQFLLGGGATQGLDQLYDRLSSQEARRLDTRAAAGGGFNSGAALRAQEESGADLAAQHVRDYMTASNQADASRNAYQRYGLDLSSAADSGLRGRISTGLTGANMVDTTALNRAKAGQDLYTGIGDETRSNIDLGGKLAGASQDSWLARLKAGSETADMSNKSWLERLAGETTAANDLSNQWRERLDSGSTASSRAQDDANKRINTGITAADSSQRAWSDRLKNAAGLTEDEQRLALERLLGGGTLATSAGNEDYRRLAGGMDAASSAQNLKERREAGVLDNLLKVAGPQAGATERGNDQARTEQAQFAMDQINGMLRSGQITAEEAQAKYGAQMAALGLVIQGGKVVMGAMTGNPAAIAGGATPPPSTTPSGVPVWSGDYAGSDPNDGPYGKYGYVV